VIARGFSIKDRPARAGLVLEEEDWYTDKKERKKFLTFKEIQKGAVAKSYMTNGLLIYDKYLHISSYIRKPFLIYDFATASL
jgi:hypothetical protein